VMNYEEFKTKKLEDIGTRYQHYSDLISLWEEGAELISQYSVIGKHDQARLEQLNASIDLLRNTLDGMSDYHDTLVMLRRLVDYIPTLAEDITGGRGTPIDKTKQLPPGDVS
jgi:hypothetical protein